jgi:hypothetical protein
MSIRIYIFQGGESRPAWFQYLSPCRMKFGSGPSALQTETKEKRASRNHR